MTPHDNPVTADDTTVGVAAPADGLHPVSNLRGIFAAYARLGYDIDTLLAPAGLRRSDIEDPDKYIPSGVCNAIFRRAWETRPVTNLALRLAIEMPIGANPLLDYLIASSDSVREGLLRLGRFLGLVNAGIHISLREQDDPARVLLEAGGDQFRLEFGLSISVLRFMAEADGDFRVTQICFVHEPEDVGEFERVLRCPAHTRASWNGWATTKDSLRLPMKRRDPMLNRWLERRAEVILAHQPTCDTVAFEVRRLLSTSIAGGDTRIDAVASQLAMTPRTLQRRLADEGTTYEALRDETRKQAAETFLADQSLSITEIAYLLGYAEPTAFHRAFKRWHGTTAQAFRDQQQPR